MRWQTWVQIPPALRPVALSPITAPESPFPQLCMRILVTQRNPDILNYSQDARNHHHPLAFVQAATPPAKAISRPLPPLLAPTLVWQTELAAQASIGSLQLKIHPLAMVSG